MGPQLGLLLITDRKWHIGFQLNDLQIIDPAWMILKISTATETVQAVHARLLSQGVLVVRKICETWIRYFCWLITTVAVYFASETIAYHRARCVLYYRL